MSAGPRPTARAVALAALAAVLDRKRPLDEVLADDLGHGALEARDRAFVRVLAATVLRRLGQIDALLAHCLERPLPRREAAARHVLRLGVAQLLFTGTPAHAAIGETVALAKAAAPHHARLVNAVLRRLQREGAALVAAQDAARLDTPDWLWRSWVAAHGEARARAIAEAHLGEAPLDLSVARDPEAWAARLDAAILPTGSLRRAAGGAVEALEGYGEGAWWVQDAAARLPARLLGEVAGLAVADLCAAPGGKTLQLAAAGARVTAVDRSAPRMARLAANLARTGLAAATVTADALAWRPESPVDAVLLDAPCSGTGTIRRHPDIARLKRPDDVARLADLQARLLDHALAVVKPGGLVVYAVCSLEPEEGTHQVARLLKARGDVRRVPVTPAEAAGDGDLVDPAGDLRTLPCHWPEAGGLDGFFAARLRRIS